MNVDYTFIFRYVAYFFFFVRWTEIQINEHHSYRFGSLIAVADNVGRGAGELEILGGELLRESSLVVSS
jgi:hypothetical protein